MIAVSASLPLLNTPICFRCDESPRITVPAWSRGLAIARGESPEPLRRVQEAEQLEPLSRVEGGGGVDEEEEEDPPLRVASKERKGEMSARLRGGSERAADEHKAMKVI